MTYGQIISILFVALLCYYAFLIVMDIQRAKAAEAAEQDNHVEEDIDRKSTRLNSSHRLEARMPSSA